MIEELPTSALGFTTSWRMNRGAKQTVKLTFARGASLADPRGFFKSSLDGNTRRAIDIREGEAHDAEAFKALIQAAVAENLRSRAGKSQGRGRTRAGSPSERRREVLLRQALEPANSVEQPEAIVT